MKRFVLAILFISFVVTLHADGLDVSDTKGLTAQQAADPDLWKNTGVFSSTYTFNGALSTFVEAVKDLSSRLDALEAQQP